MGFCHAYAIKYVSLNTLKRGKQRQWNTNVMSYSVTFFGKPEKVVEALESYSEKLSGPSKDEYDKALPNITGLVKQNFGTESQLLKVSANGHGTFQNGEPTQSYCAVNIETVYGLLV